MRRLLFATAAILPALLGALPSAARDYEGFWSTEPKDCRGVSDFLGTGRTLIVESGTLRSKTLNCEIKSVVGTSRDQMDLSCRGPSRQEQRRVLSLSADRSNLVIGDTAGGPSEVFFRCGRPPVAQRGRGSHAAAVRFEDQGEALLGSGDYARAEALFTKSVKADPEYGSAFNNRGFAKRLQRRYADAIEDYDEAIRLEPATAVYYSNRGVAYDAIDKLHNALADFNKSIELDRRAPTALNGRGSVLRQLGQIDKAIIDLEAALRIDPGYVVCLNNLAVAYRQKGERSRALGLFNRALAIEPSNAYALKERAAT